MELKPCPFCGGEAEIAFIQNKTDQYHLPTLVNLSIKCKSCGVEFCDGIVIPPFQRVPAKAVDDKLIELADKWNRRV